MSVEHTSSEAAIESEENLRAEAEEAQGENNLEQAEKPEEHPPEDQAEVLGREVADLTEQLLRKQADFENFRKRLLREKEDSVRYGNANLLLDLVQVMDDFERAIKSSEESKDFDSFHSGVEMIEKQLIGLLDRKYGLKRFDSEGEPFDPDKHEAIAMEDSTEHDTMVVLEDFQKGYCLHDRVLRHAKVKVSKPLEEPEEDLSAEPEKTEDKKRSQ